MAEEFNLEGMLDTYLFENEQLLEQLQEIVLHLSDPEQSPEAAPGDCSGSERCRMF